MKKLTRRDVIEAAADRFAGTHNRSLFLPGARLSNGRSMQDVLGLLRKLDLNAATVQEVDRIVGDDSMTRMPCHECGADDGLVVAFCEKRVAQPPAICLPCLRRAITLLES